MTTSLANLNATRAALVHAVLDGDLFGDACDLFSLERADGVKRHQAVAALVAEAGVNVIFSIPTDSSNVYITVSDGDLSLVRQVLATLEDIEADAPLKLGKVQPFDDAYLKARDIHAILLLPARTSHVLDFLPDAITVGARSYPLLLVVFLSEREHRIWKVDGHDALMDDFSARGKDLIAFGSA